MSVTAYIALGSNLGDRYANLGFAVRSLCEASSDIQITRMS